ncbi:MAG: divergent polysaccharide deacetylase family protein [Candidatus Marinimicrobia bacterium]|nr:divergent polysaccharide deacetylase family protein [Candidatus Neomarinimicrobiota bacterium]MBL7023569.1 divergent polysaccharide deacetylase family protein [Candidatus Neomarinimicrobiota bacterium]MBL7109850.1 divergent polysaccharide deacetylase family protein [Candidatus Neomarinimicrobiota bacterium]
MFRLYLILVISLFVSSCKKEIEKPITPKGNICLIIDDFGYSYNETIQSYLSLEPNFTCSVIPGHNFSSQIGLVADSLGFEVMIHMPMESFDYDQSHEKKYLLTDKMNINVLKELLTSAFDEIPQAIGMNNHQGSKATESLQLMKDLARNLKEMDKYFIDSYTNPESRAFITMRQFGVKTEVRQIFLDHIEDYESVKNKLYELAQLSHNMHVAIGIGHATKPITLEVLQNEIPKLKQLGYQFLNSSEVVR